MYRIINKISLLVLLLMCGIAGKAQITLTYGNGYLEKPAGVLCKIMQKEVSEVWQAGAAQGNEALTTHKYVDGFGRPLQSIVVNASPTGKDIINFQKYDQYGRESINYLPFQSLSSNGTYIDRVDVINEQYVFYNSNTTTNRVAADTAPYSELAFEASPLDRMVKQGGVGANYQLNAHYKEFSYRANTSTDAVRKWDAIGVSSGTYSANELSVAEGTDEAGNVSFIFTDKLGRTVLKRQKADETIGGTLYTYFDTYYLYDLAGNIAYVVPPKAVVKMQATSYNVTSAPNLIFSYKYDNKGRVVEKKVPGANVMYIVYDPLDRIVLIQDGKMRPTNKWQYKKYDSKGRIITEGVYTHGSALDQANMQSYVDGLSYTVYYEDRTSSTTSGYTNNSFPTSGTDERMYYYFDDYDFNNNGTADYTYQSQGLTGEATPASYTLGMMTGVSQRILGTSTWITTISFYDKNGRVTQTRGNNQFGSTVSDHQTSVLDFTGKPTEMKTYTTTGSVSLTTVHKFLYDVLGHTTELRESINGGSEIVVAKYEYNARGQLVDKKLHSTNGVNFLQSVDLRYNIRGQLTSINNSVLTNDGVKNDDAGDLFGMEMLYDVADAGLGNTANYTGLLSGIKWSAKTPSISSPDERGFRYTYDKVNRLTAATYRARANGSGSWSLNADGYNESMSYDQNGNILSLARNYVNGSGTTTQIDNLAYDYGTGNDKNELENVVDNSDASTLSLPGFKKFTSSGSGYAYDENGNIITDNNKGITLEYNDLNKISKIIQTSSGKYVEYRYGATGVKLSKWVYDGSTLKKLEYISGIVFEDGALSHFSMAEGRVRNQSGTFKYEYFISDHLGSVRLSFEDNSGTAVVKQETSFYAFGLTMPGGYTPTDPNKKLYNAGSELQDDFGGIIDFYSTFFREYDPVLGRFNGVDPETERFESWTPYQYAYDNPVNFNDPMGNAAKPSLEEIVNQLTNSAHGGYWSAASGYIYFDSEEQALTAGQLILEYGALTELFRGGGGSGGGSGAGGNNADETLKSVLNKLREIRVSFIVNGSYSFTYLRYMGSRSTFDRDIREVGETTTGAFLLAMIEVFGTSVFINDAPSLLSTGTDPMVSPHGNFLGVSISYFSPKIGGILKEGNSYTYVTGALILVHEIAHAVDIVCEIKGMTNYLAPIDRTDPNYHNSVLSAQLGSPDDNRFFREMRATMIENMFRREKGLNPRRNYSGIDLTPYLDFTNYAGTVPL